jgi:hypothetical protein
MPNKLSGGAKFGLKNVHIETITVGDTVLVDGMLKTVGKHDIKFNSFIGTSLFGDTYNLGTKPVLKACINVAKVGAA